MPHNFQAYCVEVKARAWNFSLGSFFVFVSLQNDGANNSMHLQSDLLSEHGFDQFLNHIYSHGVAEGLVSLCGADPFGVVVGKSLEAFAFDGSEPTDFSFDGVAVPILFASMR